ncbi:hypothetical protein [Microbulbifer guangxiensis]|uniref:hypothetical protein n=1 Tax=Microbulbifer guangxiensis TaxID=2904249 RepID=UPI001F35BA23|nr:hypothetical protein [Microbulbifer guangxiensis]
MASDDFADVAEPWLRELKENPDFPPLPDDLEPTTFPLEGAEIDGQPTEIDPEADYSPLPDEALAEEDIEAGREAHRNSGIDVLAFYKSFRFRNRPPCRGKWGIFLFDVGISAIRAEYAAVTVGLSPNELHKLAIDTLVAHERYHFWVDVWALGQEVLPARNRIKRYEHYLASCRNLIFCEYDYEESLANHYAYSRLRSRKLSDGSRAGRLIKNLFKKSPEPYSDFLFEAPERANREALLAGAIVNGVDPYIAVLLTARGSRAVIGPSIRPADARHPAVGHQKCPVYVLKVTGYAKRVRPFLGVKLKEFRLFIEQYLAGKKLSHTDHDYYRIDNGEKVKFPNEHDKNVQGNELINILRKAGMTPSDYRKARTATQKWKVDCPRSEPKEAFGS